MPHPEIIFEDYYLLVVNKPAGLMVENDSFNNPSLQQWALMHLQKKFPTNKGFFVAFPHRIDRATQGIVVIAKTKAALTELSRQFENHAVTKIYFALIEKPPRHQTGMLMHFLKKDLKEKKALISKTARANFKECALRYEIAGTTINNFCLLKIELLTGRYHQIRAQLAHEGLPVVGDAKYGSQVKYPENAIALIAKEILFKHPKSLEELFYEVPFPENGLWKM
jgi:23S rRNA pseudouridine1911/1915/1917 synthase